MDKKTTGCVSYLTWIGWVIAYCAGDKESARFHMNQSLVLWLAELVIIIVAKMTRWIPLIGWLIGIVIGICQIFIIVLLVMGFIGALRDEEKPLPLIGDIQLLK